MFKKIIIHKCKKNYYYIFQKKLLLLFFFLTYKKKIFLLKHKNGKPHNTQTKANRKKKRY